MLIGKALNSFSIFNYLGVHVGAGEKMQCERVGEIPAID